MDRRPRVSKRNKGNCIRRCGNHRRFIYKGSRETLEMRDMRFNRIVTIVDRQEGGERAIIDAGLELKSLFTIDDLCQE